MSRSPRFLKVIASRSPLKIRRRRAATPQKSSLRLSTHPCTPRLTSTIPLLTRFIIKTKKVRKDRGKVNNLWTMKIQGEPLRSTPCIAHNTPLQFTNRPKRPNLWSIWAQLSSLSCLLILRVNLSSSKLWRSCCSVAMLTQVDTKWRKSQWSSNQGTPTRPKGLTMGSRHTLTFAKPNCTVNLTSIKLTWKERRRTTLRLTTILKLTTRS